MGSSLRTHGEHLHSAFELAEEFSSLPLSECVTRGPESTLTNTAYAQPAIVAISVAYADFLREHGVRPTAVAGHSLGELSALYAAGVLSAKDTLRLAAIRGQVMSQSAKGTMVAVKSLAAAEVEDYVRESRIRFACGRQSKTRRSKRSSLVISGRVSDSSECSLKRGIASCV